MHLCNDCCWLQEWGFSDQDWEQPRYTLTALPIAHFDFPPYGLLSEIIMPALKFLWKSRPQTYLECCYLPHDSHSPNILGEISCPASHFCNMQCPVLGKPLVTFLPLISAYHLIVLWRYAAGRKFPGWFKLELPAYVN